jgi:hypothetical protein
MDKHFDRVPHDSALGCFVSLFKVCKFFIAWTKSMIHLCHFSLAKTKKPLPHTSCIKITSNKTVGVHCMWAGSDFVAITCQCCTATCICQKMDRGPRWLLFYADFLAHLLSCSVTVSSSLCGPL